MTLTAKFEVKVEMSNFNFTSTATTCSITGIKDKTVTEIIVPDYVTSISEGAFLFCSSLKRITIPFVGSSRKATTVGSLFGYIFGSDDYITLEETPQYYSSYDNQYTIYYDIPTSLRQVTVTGGDIAYGAFSHCEFLTNITLHGNVTMIGSCAFYNCDGLKSITIPDSVTSIGKQAFVGCDSLTSVVIPDSVTSIGSSAFSGCSSLTSVVIGDSVTRIGEYAFDWCTSLTSVYYKGTASDWSKISISSSNNTTLTNATRYYYSGTEPTTSGNYWHYDTDGITPVIWVYTKPKE